MAARAKTLLLLLAALCLPAFAHVPRPSLVAQKPHQGVERFAQPSHRGPGDANALTAPGLPGCLYDKGRRSRSTAKERDEESGLDYFGARYFSASLGRFTSPDGPFMDQSPVDPRSWNLYSYTRNNPLRYVDSSGNFIETVWDVANVIWGAKSFVDNVSQGNYGSATLDAVGVIADSAAVLLPGVPGGAGAAIKVARAGDKLNDARKATEVGAAAGTTAKKLEKVSDVGDSTVGVVPKSPTGRGAVPPSERDPKRLFSRGDVSKKLDEQGGKCAGCAKEIDVSEAQGHHVTRHADGGRTVQSNQAAICKECHIEVHKP